ncbi:MAG: hypothetical protein WCF85_16820 [Rhodospirillaceae bacterium]
MDSHAVNSAKIHDLGQRVARWLRQTYGRGVTKHAARELGVSPGTVKTWLSGRAPTTPHLHAMAGRWGWRFIRHAYEGACGRPAFEDRLERLETTIDRLGAALPALISSENRRGA